MSVSAREAVLLQLNAFRSAGQQSGFFVDKLNKEFGLDDKDASLAVNIFLGCVQFRYRLDFCIAFFSDIPAEKIDSCVMNILRMGAYQLLYLDRIPSHAAVDEAVKLCRKYRPKACPFVNAVLRRISSVKDNPPEPSGDSATKLSVFYSAEKWFVEYLIERFGSDSAEAFLQESNKPALLSIKINTLRISWDDYKAYLDERSIPYRYFAFDDILLVDSCSVKDLPGYADGFFFVQDPAAAACAAISGIVPGMRILDACASPGGKSFSAAVRMKNEGSILACDINSKKAAKVAEGASRLGLDIISCSVRDARIYDPELDSAFDAVFADVPCSGFGVLRKKPEIKYKRADEISGLPGIQQSILANLCRYVRPGGTLLYSTCTVLREENELIVERFLSEHDDFRAADFELRGIRSADGMYTFLPQADGTDGFFAAKLIRAL